jgi:hypothetical protein
MIQGDDMSFYVDEMYGLMSMTVRMQPTKQEKFPSLFPLCFDIHLVFFASFARQTRRDRRAIRFRV